MSLRTLALPVIAALLVLARTEGTAVQSPPGAASGHYTSAQADEGRGVFKAQCSRCHGEAMQGGVEEPPLAGPRFLDKWGDRTIHDLLNFIQTRMPPQNPGGLGEAANLQLVAHILRSNGAQSGSEPLRSGVASSVGSVAGRAQPSQSTGDRPAPASIERALASAVEGIATAEAAPITQAAPHPAPVHTGLSSLVHATFDDFKALPKRRSTWIVLGVGGGLAAIAHPADDTLNAHLVGAGTGRFFAPGKYVGGTAMVVGVPLGVYAIGRYVMPANVDGRHTNKMSHLGFDLVRAQIMSGMLVQAVKQTVRRSRPSGNCCAFPSGHTAAAFATAAVLERHLGSRLAWPAMLVAGYVGASRLHDNVHFLSDVVFGAAVGTAAGWTVVGRHGRSNYTLGPQPVPGGVALVWTYRDRDSERP